MLLKMIPMQVRSHLGPVLAWNEIRWHFGPILERENYSTRNIEGHWSAAKMSWRQL